jgi:hypothetical protein
MTVEMKGMMKWPLIIAAVIVLVRVVLEQAGAPELVNNIFGVAWLYFIVPVYFALRIAASGVAKRAKALFKNLLLFSLYTRLMVIPAYWLAYAFQWPAPRFSLEMGGVVGEGISPLAGYVGVPIRNAVVWVIAATVIGMVLGGITLLFRRRGRASTSEGAAS